MLDKRIVAYKRWLCNENNKICIFSAGIRGVDWCYAILSKQFSIKVNYFCDNDIEKQGKYFNGIKCISPKELEKIKNKVVVFLAVPLKFHKKVKKQLRSLGLTKIIRFLYPSDLLFLKDIFPKELNMPKAEDIIDKKTRLIAIYLPQFHSIPENDKWWGKGFTEWTNVKTLYDYSPNFTTPTLPGELGYYNLNDISVMKKQTDLARSYGIHAFCFYHYYLGNGKKLLYKPLENYLNSDIDFPFCLCWANHNWTRNWGADIEHRQILIEQTYNDNEKHFEYLLPFLRDKRYIKIDGKPIFVVFLAEDLPNNFVSDFRSFFKKNGLPEIYMVKSNFKEGYVPPRKLGFDAAMETPPTWTDIAGDEILNGIFENHRVFDYEDHMEISVDNLNPKYKKFPSVFPRWNNTPRAKDKSFLMLNSTPEKYRQWLSLSIDSVKNNPSEERIVFINAWNEWGEGAVLEPDLLQGRAYLRATLQSLNPKIRKLDVENWKWRQK